MLIFVIILIVVVALLAWVSRSAQADPGCVCGAPRSMHPVPGHTFTLPRDYYGEEGL